MGKAVVWVEGEAGIGKSSLIAEALAATAGPGWEIGWGIADRLTERLPLRVMPDCLQVRLVPLTRGGRKPPSCSAVSGRE